MASNGMNYYQVFLASVKRYTVYTPPGMHTLAADIHLFEKFVSWDLRVKFLEDIQIVWKEFSTPSSGFCRDDDISKEKVPQGGS